MWKIGGNLMFYEPIRYVPFASLEELKENSIQMFVSCLGSPKQYTHYQDSIVYIDGRSQTFVTPLRRETPKILEDNGYKEGEYFIRSADKEYIDKLRFAVDGEEYKWLEYMAKEQSWNFAYQEAHKTALRKNIQEIEPDMYPIAELECIEDEKTIGNTTFNRMMTNKILGYANVGSFIRESNNRVLLCDEYGRTFLVTFKYSANEFINQLIDANYTRALYPWIFIQKHEE